MTDGTAEDMLDAVGAAPVARDREIGVVRTALAALRGGRGGVILVEGGSGIGKTFVLDAALGIAGEGLEVARATCDEWGQRFELSAISCALGVGWTPVGLDRAAGTVTMASEFMMTGGRAAVLEDAVFAAMDELVALVRRRCVGGPLVVLIEDLQWADEASASVWRELCRYTVQLPLLVLGSLRPDDRLRLARLRRQVTLYRGAVLELGRLTETAVVAMAGRLLGVPPGPKLRDLLGTAAGVPRNIAELVDVASRLSMLSAIAGEVELADGGEGLDISPDLIAGWAKALADRLGVLSPGMPGALDILRSAAVVGDQFCERDLSRLLGRPVDELSAVLGAMVDAGLLARADGRLEFRHALIRRVLYESLPAALRSVMHRDVARLLIGTETPPERIARHLLASTREAERWEADWLIENVEKLVGREPSTAVKMIEHVLAQLCPEDPRQPRLQDRLAQICLALERYEQAERLSRAVLEHSRDPDRVGAAVWIAGLSVLCVRGPDAALRLLEEASARRGIPDAWQARNAALRSMTLLMVGRSESAGLAAEEALEAGRIIGDQIAVCCALYVRSAVRAARRDTACALADVEEALPIAESLPELANIRVLLLGNRFAYRFAVGARGGALDEVRQALTVAVRLDSPWQSRLRWQAADLFYDLGCWDEAAECLRGRADPMELAVAALIAEHRDEPAEASRHLRALDVALQGVDLDLEGYGPRLYSLAARALEAERRGGSLRTVVAELKVCVAPEHAYRMPQRYRMLPMLARLALLAGDTHAAGEAAATAEWEARVEPTPRKRAVAEWCDGLVRGDPVPILRAAEYHRGAGLGLHAGHAWEYAAELLALAGDLPGARSALDEALAAYDELGVRWDTRRAVARLRACGVRFGARGARGTRDRPAAGPGALTAAEFRVAELVAEGCPSPEIAVRLCVSRRTVESHVSQILAKLQISSRREIRDLLRAEEPDGC